VSAPPLSHHEFSQHACTHQHSRLCGVYLCPRKGSMCKNYSCPPDFCLASESEIRLCIRDHKTARKTGPRTYVVQPPLPLFELLTTWLRKKRPGMNIMLHCTTEPICCLTCGTQCPKCVSRCACDAGLGRNRRHKRVFLKQTSGARFNEKSFSSYLQDSFERVTTYRLGSQKMRRIFATGYCLVYLMQPTYNCGFYLLHTSR